VSQSSEVRVCRSGPEALEPNTPTERATIGILLIFIAHSLIFDEFVPLRCWHEWLFQSSCSFTRLNGLVAQVMKCWGLRLSVDEQTIRQNLRAFDSLKF
jgi:hypothetical protein